MHTERAWIRRREKGLHMRHISDYLSRLCRVSDWYFFFSPDIEPLFKIKINYPTKWRCSEPSSSHGVVECVDDDCRGLSYPGFYVPIYSFHYLLRHRTYIYLNFSYPKNAVFINFLTVTYLLLTTIKYIKMIEMIISKKANCL